MVLENAESWIHHFNSLQTSSITETPRRSLQPVGQLCPLPPTPETIDLFSVPIMLPFSECHMTGSKHLQALGFGFSHLKRYNLVSSCYFTHLAPVPCYCCAWRDCCLSIHLLKDILALPMIDCYEYSYSKHQCKVLMSFQFTCINTQNQDCWVA